MTLYRGMDRAALDAAYNNRAAVKAYPAISAARAEESARYRAATRFEADLRYGGGPRERIDFFPARTPGAPVVAFIHGGYWQSNDKEASSFLAPGPIACGFSVALIEYTLAPGARMGQIVAEVRRAVDWLAANAARLGAGPIYVAGNSAGGHLAACTLDLPAVRGVVAISGLYDLEPISLNYLNDALRLSSEEVARYSPLRNIPATPAPIVVAVGSAELPELVRQSADYAAALKAKGLRAEYLPLAGHDHFSILEELRRPDGALCRALLGIAG